MFFEDIQTHSGVDIIENIQLFIGYKVQDHAQFSDGLRVLFY